MKNYLIFIICVLYSVLSIANEKEIEAETIMFRSLTKSNGLSNNNVSAIYRDSKGYFWIGTSSGLNRWDAYNYEDYHYSSEGFPLNTIMSIFEDYENRIWVNCDNIKYAFYDYDRNCFYNNVDSVLSEYGFKPEMTKYIGSSEDRRYFWGSNRNSISIYDFTQKKLNSYTFPVGFRLSKAYIKGSLLYAVCNDNGQIHIIDLNGNYTQTIPCPKEYKNDIIKKHPSLYIDSKGGLWLYTFSNDIILYKAATSSIWEKISLPIYSDQFNRVAQIAEDYEGNMWFVTSHHGAFIYELPSKQIIHLTHDPLQNHTLVSNNLTSLFIDKDNTVWISSSKQGISYYMPSKQPILGYSLNNEYDVLSFCEIDNHLYLGTDGSGLLCLNQLDKSFTSVQIDANIVVCQYKDSYNRLWLGTFQSGLICIGSNQNRHYTAHNSQLESNDVYGIKEDINGNIWIALLNGIVQKLEPETGNMTTIFKDTTINIRELISDGNSILYGATSKGLLVVDTENEQGYIVSKNHSQKAIIPESYLYSLYLDHHRVLWMGTAEGLVYWNLSTDHVGKVTTKDGLQTNLVTSIIEDHLGQLWIGTYNGISCINGSDSLRITNYNTSDGLITNEINQRSAYLSRNGKILFGTPQGLIEISPQLEDSKDYDKQVYLTDIFFTADYSVQNTIVEYSFNGDELCLRGKKLPFSLHFSTFDYSAPDNIKYLYRIDNEDAWHLMNRNAIYFTSLNPGKYKLCITTCNAQGMFSRNIKNMVIHVLPPWYRTSTAYLLYALVIAALLMVFSILLYRHQRRKQYTKQLIQESEQKQKLMDMKLTFFANISHELRTPLSLIINPLEEFVKRNPQMSSTLLDMARTNAKYLFELIDQLLAFRKIDSGGETIDYSHVDVIRLSKDIFINYQQVADKHKINYTLNVGQNSILIDCDRSKFMKIVHNLLSNAFKFTPDGGDIELKITQDESELNLSVTDTGPGIPIDDRNEIFSMFFQSKSHHSSMGGSGIGLYLVKQYAQMHKGDVLFENNHPTGSVFTVKLPLRAQLNQFVHDCFHHEVSKEKANVAITIHHDYSLLIVDDNAEFLEFLTESLATDYRIYKSLSAFEAIEILEKENIDLVISDVMMPKMSGLEFCRIIKNNLATSHIPVILLTAKAGEEFQLEGLSQGADDYITKPFHMEILKMRINKFIENSIRNHQTFQNDTFIESEKITITSLDSQFVDKSIKIIEDNLSNENFSIEELASQLCISRGYLYRKLLKITGKTPIEFVRSIRMKRAKQLLTEEQLKVSVVADKLGYSLAKTFTKHFKQEFGITPQQYAQNHKIKK